MPTIKTLLELHQSRVTESARATIAQHMFEQCMVARFGTPTPSHFELCRAIMAENPHDDTVTIEEYAEEIFNIASMLVV